MPPVADVIDEEIAQHGKCAGRPDPGQQPGKAEHRGCLRRRGRGLRDHLGGRDLRCIAGQRLRLGRGREQIENAHRRGNLHRQQKPQGRSDPQNHQHGPVDPVLQRGAKQRNDQNHHTPCKTHMQQIHPRPSFLLV